MYFGDYLIVNGEKLGEGTKIKITRECWMRRPSFLSGFPNDVHTIRYPQFHDDGSVTLVCAKGLIENFVWERDVAELVEVVPYVPPKTAQEIAKDRIREKREKGLGTVLAYIWPGTIVYILSLLIMPIFREFIWGWIAATILYCHYCHEQLSG